MSSNPLFRLALAAAIAVAAGGNKTCAQYANEMATMNANCRMDCMRFCAGMSPGGPEIRACFKRNRDNLSSGCGEAIDAYHQRERDRQTGRLGRDAGDVEAGAADHPCLDHRDPLAGFGLVHPHGLAGLASAQDRGVVVFDRPP